MKTNVLNGLSSPGEAIYTNTTAVSWILWPILKYWNSLSSSDSVGPLLGAVSAGSHFNGAGNLLYKVILKQNIILPDLYILLTSSWNASYKSIMNNIIDY